MTDASKCRNKEKFLQLVTDSDTTLISEINERIRNREMKPKFKLVCAAGTYEANSLWSIIVEVLKHRFWHLRTYGKWMD